MIQEKTFRPISGWIVLPIYLVVLFGVIGWFVYQVLHFGEPGFWQVFVLVATLTAATIAAFGFQAVAPNAARALLLFGEYAGSITKSGFYWVNPFYSKKKISLRVRNFETGSIESPEKKDAMGQVVQQKTRSSGKPSKVNDRDGNPIDISAVVVWKVINTAEALFEVDDYEHFVAVQSEAALRGMATRHPYDSEDHEMSLRGNTVEVCEQLREDIQERLEKAGVEVIEARRASSPFPPSVVVIGTARNVS